MQLVHVLGVLAAGGAEKFVANLARAQSRRGWDVALVAATGYRDPVGPQLGRQLVESGVALEVGPTDALRLRAIFWYLGRMRALRPEIVHLHTPNTEVLQLLVPPTLAPLRGAVRTVHGTELGAYDMDAFALRQNAVGCSIFCSEASYQANRHWVRGPTQVIASGVPLDQPPRTPERSRQAKAELGLDPQRIHFLHVGRMTEGTLTTSPKAHDVTLRAWRESGVGASAGVLHLLGDGDLRPALEPIAAGDPSVVFHGIVSNVDRWMTAADCFVMPSRYEGLPVAGLEAVTTGLPCIFTRIQPLRELNAPQALWCDVDDVHGLARCIAEFAQSQPCVDARALDALRLSFGIDRVAERYDAVYRSLGAAPARGPASAVRGPA